MTARASLGVRTTGTRDGMRARGGDDYVADLETKHRPVEKQDAAQCLVLSRGSDVLIDGKPGDEGGNFRRRQFTRVTPAVEHDEYASSVRRL